MVGSSFVTVDASGARPVARVVCPTVGQREAEIIQKELIDTADKHSHRIAVDLSDVTLLTSMGIGALVTIHNTCKKAKGKVAFFGIRPEIMDVLSITRMDRFFTIKKDQAAAIAAVK